MCVLGTGVLIGNCRLFSRRFGWHTAYFESIAYGMAWQSPSVQSAEENVTAGSRRIQVSRNVDGLSNRREVM